MSSSPSIASAHEAPDTVVHATMGRLCLEIDNARKAHDIAKVDFARAAGVSRMTYQRMLGGQTVPNVGTLIAMGATAGLDLSWVPRPGAASPIQNKFTHTGLAISRVRRDCDAADTRRERALAQCWQELNKPSRVTRPALQSLVPEHDQAQATAVATVVQWLGSQQGMFFLEEAMKQAGFQITEISKSKK